MTTNGSFELNTHLRKAAQEAKAAYDELSAAVAVFKKHGQSTFFADGTAYQKANQIWCDAKSAAHEHVGNRAIREASAIIQNEGLLTGWCRDTFSTDIDAVVGWTQQDVKEMLQAYDGTDHPNYAAYEDER